MTASERAAALARRQRGRITAAQLRDAGLSDDEIRGRVRRGELVAEHRGVYAYAALPKIPFGKEHAALLACGDEAKLSHRSAGAIRRLTPLTAAVDVTLPPGRRREHHGITIHRKPIEDHERILFDGLKITSIERTLHDLAEVLTVSALRLAINEAYVQGLITPGQLEAREGTRGAPTMREALQDVQLTRSGVERRFGRLIRQAGIRSPDDTNVRFDAFTVDALWIPERVAVEIDVFTTHAGPDKFHTDHRKTLVMSAKGFNLRRYTDVLIDDEPLKLIADLARALTR